MDRGAATISFYGPPPWVAGRTLYIGAEVLLVVSVVQDPLDRYWLVMLEGPGLPVCASGAQPWSFSTEDQLRAYIDESWWPTEWGPLPPPRYRV